MGYIPDHPARVAYSDAAGGDVTCDNASGTNGGTYH